MAFFWTYMCMPLNYATKIIVISNRCYGLRPLLTALFFLQSTLTHVNEVLGYSAIALNFPGSHTSQQRLQSITSLLLFLLLSTPSPLSSPLKVNKLKPLSFLPKNMHVCYRLSLDIILKSKEKRGITNIL